MVEEVGDVKGMRVDQNTVPLEVCPLEAVATL